MFFLQEASKNGIVSVAAGRRIGDLVWHGLRQQQRRHGDHCHYQLPRQRDCQTIRRMLRGNLQFTKSRSMCCLPQLSIL